MAKDVIFTDRPVEKKMPISQCIQNHSRFNEMLELMKHEIQSTPTLKDAKTLLIEKFGHEYMLFIVQTLREVFGTSISEIERAA